MSYVRRTTIDRMARTGAAMPRWVKKEKVQKAYGVWDRTEGRIGWVVCTPVGDVVLGLSGTPLTTWITGASFEYMKGRAERSYFNREG